MLTERDVNLLKALHKFRFLSSAQAKRAGGFTSMDTARFRLRVLRGLGMVKCFKHLTGEHVHFISNDACEFIGKPALNMRPPQSLLFVQHLLDTVDFWMALMLSPLRRQEQVGAGFIPYFYNKPGSQSAAKIIQARAGNGKRYTPDGAMVLHRKSGEGTPQLFFVEIDRGTSAPKRVEEALNFYYRYLAGGEFRVHYKRLYNHDFEYFRILVVTNDAGRMERLRALDIPEDFRKFLLFTDGYGEDPLGRVWVNGCGAERVGIVRVVGVRDLGRGE